MESLVGYKSSHSVDKIQGRKCMYDDDNDDEPELVLRMIASLEMKVLMTRKVSMYRKVTNKHRRERRKKRESER